MFSTSSAHQTRSEMASGANAVVEDVPSFVLNEDAWRWADKRPRLTHAERDSVRYAFICLRRGEFELALAQFKLCSNFDRSNFKLIYYVIALSTELDIGPDVYLRDISPTRRAVATRDYRRYCEQLNLYTADYHL